jgi:hypothetical protein
MSDLQKAQLLAQIHPKTWRRLTKEQRREVFAKVEDECDIKQIEKAFKAVKNKDVPRP